VAFTESPFLRELSVLVQGTAVEAAVVLAEAAA